MERTRVRGHVPGTVDGALASTDAALEDVLGLGVFGVKRSVVRLEGEPELELMAEVTAGDSAFQTMNSQESYRGIMKGTCQEAGYAFLESVTTWKCEANVPKDRRAASAHSPGDGTMPQTFGVLTIAIQRRLCPTTWSRTDVDITVRVDW